LFYLKIRKSMFSPFYVPTLDMTSDQ
jgi:hypothetical protein